MLTALQHVFGVSGRGLQVVPTSQAPSRAPCFAQDHKRNLISDVEKLQAWLRFILESKVRGWMETGRGSLAPQAGWGKWPRRCVCLLLTLGRESWMGKERKWHGRAERWLICWCSSVVSGPRVTNHEIDFLEPGDRSVYTECVVPLKLGQMHVSLINKSPPCCPRKGLLWNISFASQEKPEFRCIVLVYFSECSWRNNPQPLTFKNDSRASVNWSESTQVAE